MTTETLSPFERIELYMKLGIWAPASAGNAALNGYGTLLAPVPAQVVDPNKRFIVRRGPTFADLLKTDEELLAEQAVAELAADPGTTIH